jgi:hypothetical protein
MNRQESPVLFQEQGEEVHVACDMIDVTLVKGGFNHVVDTPQDAPADKARDKNATRDFRRHVCAKSCKDAFDANLRILRSSLKMRHRH